MFVGQSWREIEGEIFDGRVRVGPLLNADREALFEAEWVGVAAPEIVVRVYTATAEPVLERHLEASFIEHPNMLRCFGAGEFHRRGQRLIYAVLARFDETLAAALRSGPLPHDEALQLGRQLSAALLYLHQQDLVYCNLDPSTITRTGATWQLGDYSQLRVAGRGYIQETRRLIALRPTTPPEAYEGVVLPTWDSWGLACVLSTAVTGTRRDARSSRRDLAEPFQSIVSECLSGDPDHRCGMERIRLLLDSAVMAATPSGIATLDQTPAAPRIPSRRPIRYLVPEAEDEPSLPSPPALVPEESTPEKTSFRDWWDQHGVLTLAAGVAALALLVLLLTYLPRHGSTDAEAAAPEVVREKPAPAAPVAGTAARKKQAPPAPAAATKGEADRTAVPAGSPESAIRALLDDWTEASRLRDAAAQSRFYAPRVDRFFQASNVTRDWVRRYREDAYRRINTVRKFDIYNVQVNVQGPQTAQVTFDKAWNFAGRSQFSGNVRSQMQLKQIDGDWRIVSERDVRVYSLRGKPL